MIINSAVGMLCEPIGRQTSTIEFIGSASCTTEQIPEIVLPEYQPRPHKRVKRKDNIVSALKFDEDNTYLLAKYTWFLIPNVSSHREKCFMSNVAYVIPRYYEKAFVNKKGEYKIWNKKIDFIQFTIKLVNLERLCIALFNMDDKAYKNHLYLIGRNNREEVKNNKDEINNKIDEIFKKPYQLTLDRLDFLLKDLSADDKIKQMNMLSRYFNQKGEFRNKLQYFYSVWQKMIFKNINELLHSNQNNASYKVLENIGVDNFIKRLKNIKQLLDNVWLNLNAAIQEYKADGKEITLDKIVNFKDPKMSDLKKRSVQKTYSGLANNRDTLRQFFENIDNLLKPLTTNIRYGLGDAYSFDEIENISEALTEELALRILEHYESIIAPQLINMIITNIFFVNQDCIPYYIDDLNIIKNGLELIEESLCYYQWG